LAPDPLAKVDLCHRKPASVVLWNLTWKTLPSYHGASSNGWWLVKTSTKRLTGRWRASILGLLCSANKRGTRPDVRLPWSKSRKFITSRFVEDSGVRRISQTYQSNLYEWYFILVISQILRRECPAKFGSSCSLRPVPEKVWNGTARGDLISDSQRPQNERDPNRTWSSLWRGVLEIGAVRSGEDFLARANPPWRWPWVRKTG
jgi:hypothetical protein